MDNINEAKWDAAFDDWIHQMVEEDAAEAVREHLDETAHCAPQVPIHLTAADGYNPDWHLPFHPADCRYCRCAARVAFRNGRPGWGMIWREWNNEDRPAWWRGAVGDYIHQHPVLRGLEGAARIADLIPARLELVPASGGTVLRGGPAGTAPGVDRIASAPDDSNHLESVLFRAVAGGKDTILLVVRDLEGRFLGSTVQVSIVGENREIVKTLKLEQRQKDPFGGISAKCEISIDEFRAAEGKEGFILSPPIIVEEQPSDA
jgi:hypothetical protein